MSEQWKRIEDERPHTYGGYIVTANGVTTWAWLREGGFVGPNGVKMEGISHWIRPPDPAPDVPITEAMKHAVTVLQSFANVSREHMDEMVYDGGARGYTQPARPMWQCMRDSAAEALAKLTGHAAKAVTWHWKDGN